MLVRILVSIAPVCKSTGDELVSMNIKVGQCSGVSLKFMFYTQRGRVSQCHLKIYKTSSNEQH